MNEANSANDLIKDFERVVKKAIEANTAYYQEAASALQRAYSGKSEMSGPAVMDSLADALTSLVKLQLRYAENLYDLQLTWSKNMAHNPKTAPAFETACEAPEAPRKTMTLSGSPGETAALILHLNSRDAAPRHCRFEHTGFFNAADGHAAPLTLICEPESFTLVAGQEVETRLVVSILETAMPGAYRNTITVLGYDDSIFDLIVVVHPKAEPPVEEEVALPENPKIKNFKTPKKQTD